MSAPRLWSSCACIVLQLTTMRRLLDVEVPGMQLERGMDFFWPQLLTEQCGLYL